MNRHAHIGALLCLACCVLLVRCETVNILINDYQVPLVEIHIANYSALTGHTVNLIPISGYSALRDQIISDLRKGSPFYDAFVFSGQMKSELILCSDCDPEQRPLIAPLTEAIRNDAKLEWNDVATFQRSINSAYNGDIYTVPVDGDFHYMYYRKDLLEKYGFEVPQTWDDVIQIGKALNGIDFNNDTFPDLGICIERANTTEWNPASYFFWTIASPMIQSKGTNQGMFFDSATMELMTNTTAFREAAETFKEISKYGFETSGGFLRFLWNYGSCAIAIDWGDIASMSQNFFSTVRNVTGMTIAPGSRRVYNRDTKQMEQCTATLCPHMDENGVNRAPFAATLGWTTAISRFIPESRFNAAYGFLSYISQSAQSMRSVLLGLGWDLVRESQMNADIFINAGFSEFTATEFVTASKQSQTHPNAVVDLPLERWSEYYGAFGPKIMAYLHDEISLDEFQTTITQEWSALLDKYGLREQHVSYALFIGAQRPTFDYEVTLPDALRIAFLAISSVSILGALGLVVFVAVHREKKVIRGTSPTFHYTTLGGACLIFLSILLFSIPQPTSELCQTSMWLFAAGFGFIYGSILVKLYRLWRLSTASLLVKKISDAHLAPMLAAILAVYIALLTAWTVIDPPVAMEYKESLEPDQYMIVCQTGATGKTLFILILGWSCILLLAGCILSFLTRNLAEAYNESRPVAMSVYIYSFSAVILVPVLFTVPSALVVFIMTCAVLVFSTVVTLIALFLGKIVRIHKGLGDKVSTGRTSSTYYSSPPVAGTENNSAPTSDPDAAKRKKLEAENRLLRDRIADLEARLTSRPHF